MRDAEGRPVEAFNLYCLPVDRGAPLVGVRRAGTFAGGKASCRLAAGRYHLLVYPRTSGALASGWSEIEIEDRDLQIEVSLPRAIERVVEVSLPGSGPVEGARVEFGTGDAPGPGDWLWPQSADVDPYDRRTADSRLMAAAVTDQNGRAVLALGEQREGYIRVSGPGLRTLVRAVDLRGGEPLQCEVEPGATLQGSIAPLDRLHALDPERDPGRGPSIYDYHSHMAPTITIEGQGWKRQRIHIDPAGRFSCQGLPTGPVQIRLYYFVSAGGRSFRLAPAPIELGGATLDSATPTRLELALPAASGR